MPKPSDNAVFPEIRINDLIDELEQLPIREDNELPLTHSEKCKLIIEIYKAHVQYEGIRHLSDSLNALAQSIDRRPQNQND